MSEAATPDLADALTPEIDPGLAARSALEGDANNRRLSLALLAAALLHTLIITIAAGGLDWLYVRLGGVPPAPREKPFGDKAGVLDGVAAEVIDAKEFDKRYIAFAAGRDAADSEAARKATRSDAAKAAEPPPDVQKEPIPGEEPQPAAQPPPKLKPLSEKPVKEQPLTEQEIEALVASSVEDLRDGVLSVSQPGAARLGQESPFVRAVLRRLKQTMPTRVGRQGIVVIQLYVAPSGDVGQIRLVKSSGRADFDALILNRVRSTHLVAPLPTTTQRERLFQITYEYR